MNNIEVQELRRDTLKFFGEGVFNKIDKMNSKQLDELKRKIHTMKQKVYPSHKEIRAKKIKQRKLMELNGPNLGPKLSVVIPYMHTKERYPLFLSCISFLKSNIEICVVEIGKKRHLFLPPDDFEYMFVKYKGVNHRAWALNLGIKHLATGENIVLLDADVIVPNNFFEAIKNVSFPAVAWSKMFYLNKENTGDFLEKTLVKGKKNIFKDFAVEEKCEKVKKPNPAGPAGGINIIPRNILIDLKGIPENFEGTWGGPDNAFVAKLEAYGHPFKILNCESIHLHHSKNTPRKNEIALKARKMMRWSREQWDKELRFIGGNWGVIDKENFSVNNAKIPDYLDINYLRKVAMGKEKQVLYHKEDVVEDLSSMWEKLNKKILTKVCSSEDTLLSLAMLSFMRSDIMLQMLDHWYMNRFIKSNIAFNVQGQERISEHKKNIIRGNMEDYFEEHHLLFTNGNRGTGMPRYNMIHKALEFNTPYIMTTDDDMFFPPGSVEALISILEDNPELGAIDMWVHPNLNAWFVGREKMDFRQPKIPFGYVDGMGSATMIVRREVFETCDYDYNYYVGWADIDFCMQMRENNWKLGIMALPNYKAFNWKGHGTKDYLEYKEHRNSLSFAGDSSTRFKNKWGKFI